ncbi:MAG: ABC transporter ATP-binding protein [Candidatus Aminicenantes bacterium]|nr:ABC transporter ATP-binding protein [Candidatus Aminicenantes bacterium]
MKQIVQLLKLAFREKKRLYLSFLCTLFVAVFTYVFVNLVQPIIDEMFVRSPAAQVPEKTRFMDFVFRTLGVSKEDLIIVIPLIVVAVILGKGLFTFLSSFLMKSVGHRVVKRMRDDIYGHILYQSSSYFDHIPTGDLMSRLTNDVDKIQQALSGSLGDFIEELFILVALLTGIFFIDWHLALVSFVVAPLAAVPLAAFSRVLKKKGLRNQEEMARIYTLLHETITGHKVVKAFTMERFELKKFMEATRRYFRTSLKLAWISSLSSPFMEFLGGVVGAFILYVGSRRIGEGVISPGDFGAFVMAVFLMYMPIKRLSKANNSIQQAVACYERIQEVMQAVPEIHDAPDAYPLPRVRGKVRFESVSFSYDGSRHALQDISFDVRPCTTAAFVGLSGAGKTTVINLLARFYEPSAGRITIDGIDIREVTLDSLRAQIGLVTQDIVLFNDTIRNNIAYGLADITSEDVVRAARAANAHEFIMDLPDGYETVIGERGGLLSSGQRQRLAIARALLKDPPILILDEATSALDSESERLIQEALARIKENRTTLVIAHRLSTIRGADRIFVIDHGRLSESGTHEELCRLNGIYMRLYELQFPEEGERGR